MRQVIVHYHIFKNAGTSLDEVLKLNFREAWITLEAESGEAELQPAQLAQAIRSRPDVRAISSHTAQLPMPDVDGDVRVLPIVFVRHPLDRIHSAFEFEKNQNAETLGSRIAREKDFAGYVKHFVQFPKDRRFRNFQTYRLAKQAAARLPGPELPAALAALAELDLVGVVELFDAAMALLKQQLAPTFPGFRTPPVRANVSKGRAATLSERLGVIEDELGPALYEQLLERNGDDMRVWAAAYSRLGDSASAGAAAPVTGAAPAVAGGS